MKAKNLLLLAALFSIALYTNLSVNTQWKPIHLDEYDHLAIARESIDMQEIVFYNPYIESHPPQGFFHSRFESSFDTLLASLLILLPIKPVNLTLPFTIFVSLLISLAAFVFSRKIFNNELAALIMAASVFLIENNLAFLGYLFMVPMSLAAAMLLALAYFFVRATSSIKHCLLFLVILANTALIHPVFPLIAIVTAIAVILLQPSIAMQNKGKIVAGGIVLGAGIVFIEFFTAFSVSELLLWEYDMYAKQYPLLEFISIPIILLALVGGAALVFDLIKNRFLGEQKQYVVFLIVAALIGLSIRIYGDLAKVCLFGPCRRTTNAFVLFVFLLAGIGVYAIIAKTLLLFKDLSPHIKKLCFLSIAFFLAVVFLSALDYTTLKYKSDITEKYQSLETAGIRAAEWLSLNASKEESVFASPWDGKGVFVVAGMNVSPTLLTRIGTIYLETAWQNEEVSHLIDFFYLNCKGKRKVLQIVDAEWIYSPRQKVECKGINKVYQGSSENHSLYRVAEKDI